MTRVNFNPGISKTVVILLVIIVHFVNSQNLYVFYPTFEKPHSIKKNLEDKLPGMNIMVFERYRAFISKVKNQPPEAMIIKTIMNDSPPLSGYSAKLNGAVNNSPIEPFVLVSVDRKVDLNAVNENTTIGVIEFLDKPRMKKFILQFFPREPKIKKVTKMKDLLPLLTYSMAQGIVIEKKYINHIKGKSELNFVITPLPESNTGILALAVKNDSDTLVQSSIINNIRALSGSPLGVDNWK